MERFSSARKKASKIIPARHGEEYEISEMPARRRRAPGRRKPGRPRKPVLKISFSHAGGGFPLILTRAQWFWGRTWKEALGREQPIATTLRSIGLSEAELDDVLWNNCFRFLGIDQQSYP